MAAVLAEALVLLAAVLVDAAQVVDVALADLLGLGQIVGRGEPHAATAQLGALQSPAQAQQARLERARQNLGLLAGKLSALSPLAVLERGYAIAMKQGRPVKEAASLAVGDTLVLRFAKGQAQASVTQIEETAAK